LPRNDPGQVVRTCPAPGAIEI